MTIVEGARLERCPRCDCVTVWVTHPAGWRCTGCSLCATEWQASLASYVDE